MKKIYLTFSLIFCQLALVNAQRIETISISSFQKDEMQMDGPIANPISNAKTANRNVPDIVYPNPNVFQVGMAITNLSPTNNGGIGEKYSTLTSLPSGLVIRESNGIISGTPLVSTVPTVYRIVARNNFGSDTFNLTIQINCVSISSISVLSNPICFDKVTTLSANGVSGANPIVNWWTGPGGTGISRGTGLSLPNAGPGTYYARVTGSCSNTAEASVVVNALALPTTSVSTNGSASICPFSSVLLNSNANAGSGTISSFVWRKNGINILGASSSTYSINETGSYAVVVTNSNGCTSTSNAIAVKVEDITAPVIPTLPTLTGQCSVIAIAPTATDNCKGTIIGTTTDPLTYSTQGTYTITWSFNDGNGNVSTATQSVVVKDNTAPVVPTLPTLTGQCSVTATAPTTTDNCKGTIIGTTTDPLTYSTQGTYTITWSFNDGNGNVSTATQSVIIKDYTVPVVPTLPTLTGQCSVTATVPSATDNCKGTIIGTTTNPLTYTSQGTYTITWSFNDGNGNVSTATQSVVVKDNTSPVVPTLPILTGQCSATATAPTTTDNCSGTIVGTTTDPLTYSTQGTYTITWSFNDGNGNVSTATQSVIIKDYTVPVVPTLPTLTGQCSVTATAPTTTDNCSGTIVGTTTDPLTYFAQGTYTITWRFDDGNGNVSTATQSVVVKDNTSPVVPTLPTLTGQCSVTATVPSATDNCKGTIIGTTTNPLTYTSQGTYTITWSFNDGNGNVSTATQSVIVKDNTVPVVPTLSTLAGQCSVTATAPTTTDNCSGTITGTTTDPLTYTSQGTYTITWSFNDGNGNVSTATQSVVVRDNTAPVIPTLSTLTGQCSVTATAPTTTDNCKGTITGTTTDPLTYTSQGTYTITWSFNDGNGNVSTATQSVVVNDNTPPVVPTLPTLTGQCSVTATAPTTTDNCKGTIIGTTTDPLTYSTQGTYTITWSFNDGNGNVSAATQSVIVKDNTVPVVPTLSTLTGQCSVTATAPTTTDNCSGTIVGTTTNPLTYTSQGTYTITWSFNDGNGNVSTTTQSVVVKDNTSPVVPTLSTLTGQCSVTATAPTTTDNCSGTITGTTTDPLTYTSQGTYTITWRFDDGNGNVSTATQSVVVKDNTAPVVPTLSMLTGQCSATATAPTTTDNCSGTITGTTTDPLTYTSQGTYTITWSFNDGNGNFSTATQSVIIKDNTVPVVPTLPTLTGQCSVTATAPTTTDNCSGTITGTTSDPLTYNVQGTYIITWSFNDGNGNFSIVTQSVVVKDDTAPVVAKIEDFWGQCDASIINIPTALDNCSGIIIGTTTDALIYRSQGNYLVTWTFNDGNGNVSTATQNVIVRDTIKPIIQIVDLLPFGPKVGACSLDTMIAPPVVSDNCGVASFSRDRMSNTYPVGTTRIIWTATDVNGNIQTAVQDVVVVDAQKPTLKLPPGLYVNADAGKCFATIVNIGTPVVSDNCGVSSVINNFPNKQFPVGSNTVVWTVTDVNGNVRTGNQRVIVVDKQLPVVSTPPAIKVFARPGLCTIDTVLVAPTATDNCGIQTITRDYTSNTFPVGVTTITWTIRDLNGNVVTRLQKVTVYDYQKPIITKPVLMYMYADSSCFARNVILTSPVAIDNCGVASFTNDYPSTTYPIGTTMVNWTARDVNGNVTVVQQKVFVVDRILPVIKTTSVTADLPLDSCGLVNVNIGTPIATDNCGIASLTNDLTSTMFPVGITNVTWTVVDVNGNVATAIQRVTVYDRQKPTIVPPAQRSVFADNGSCTASNVNLGTPVTADNCGVASVTNTAPASFPIGTTTIIWTVTDVNGNKTSNTQKIIVTDNQKPIITVPSNLSLCGGSTSYTIAALSAIDNCGVDSISYVISGATSRSGIESDASGLFNVGTSTITWRVKDRNGNIQTASTIITVAVNCTAPRSITAENVVQKVQMKQLSVFPNPTSGNFIVRLTNYSNTKPAITIIDGKGSIVKRTIVEVGSDIQSVNFNISHLAPGMYSVNVVYRGEIQTIKLFLVK